MISQPIQYGIDSLLQQASAYTGKRIAFVTNNAAVTPGKELSRVALLKAGFNIVKLFSPEHGIAVTGADGALQEDQMDTITSLPVISLYGNQLAPTAEQLQDADLVLFDIPDVGCRFYTYLWTMTHVMEACAATNKPLLIADRPNPIGALLQKAEGPMLDETSCSSFIGRWSIPIRHSCTLGELARYFAAVKTPGIDLRVIPVANYRRQFTALNDFEFIPTSPAIQQIQTALLYPGTGLLEGINVNEGRGTDKPFQQFGAPWLQHNELKLLLDRLNLPGIDFLPVSFKAMMGPYAGELCNGLHIEIINAEEIVAVQMGISIIQTIMQLHPEKVTERLYPTVANPGGGGHLDKLLGIKNAFMHLREGMTFKTDIADVWEKTMRPYLLY